MTQPADVDKVHFEVNKHVAYVTINRPKVLNAADRRIHARLCKIWEGIEANADVRATHGAGDRAFCVGADMSANGISTTGLRYWAGQDSNGFGGLSLRSSLNVSVIARVNGSALGGGMQVVHAIKQMVHHTAHLLANEAAALRVPALMAALDSEDSIEGLRAFQEKRPPIWRGR